MVARGSDTTPGTTVRTSLAGRPDTGRRTSTGEPASDPAGRRTPVGTNAIWNGGAGYVVLVQNQLPYYLPTQADRTADDDDGTLV